MKKHIKILCAMTVLAATNQAAAESFQLGITGSMSPAACTPQLDNNGTVDYGVIKSNTLNKDDYTILPERNINLNITCDAPAKVALFASSQRKGSALINGSEGSNTGAGRTLVDLGISGYSGVVGFGMDGDKKIGAYSITYINNTLLRDGIESVGMWSSDKVSWGEAGSQSLFHNLGYTRYVTIRDGGVSTPVAFTTATFPLIIKGYINKASELDISKPIKLDGLTNIEMIYL